MKRAIATLTLTFAVSAFGQGMPLPSNSSVKPPAEGIDASSKAFSGKWEGVWDGRMLHVLVVEELKANGDAVVLYAWQEPPAENAWGAGWYRTTASIEGNTLKVPLRNGTRAWYELLADGTLKGSYQRAGTSSQSSATLKKVRP